MSSITFSVIVCEGDAEGGLDETLKSVVCQTFPLDRIEAIVVGGTGSAMSTSSLAAARSGANVRFIASGDNGLRAALLAGVEAARHDFVCLLRSLDVYHPRRLDAVARRIAQLAPVGNTFFLCHDVEERNGNEHWEQASHSPQATCMKGDRSFLDLDDCRGFSQLPAPCGHVYSKDLVRRLLGAMPAADFRDRPERVLGHAAMLATGRVHLLRDTLASTRRSSKFTDDSGPSTYYADWPRLAAFLENLAYSPELDAARLRARRAYVHRLGRHVRERCRRLDSAQAPASLVVLDAGDPKRTRRTLDGACSSTYAKTDIVLVAAGAGAADQFADHHMWMCALRIVDPGADACFFDRLRTGYWAASGDYVAFLQAGDTPDPSFLERHLYGHRFLGHTAVTACDFRIVDDDHCLVHHGLLQSSGTWKRQVESVPPFALPMQRLSFPPLSSNLLRRSRLLDLFFAVDAELPGPQLDSHAGWLALQFAAGLGGVLRLNECLLSLCPGTDDVALSQAALLSPLSADRRPGPPEQDAAAGYLWRIFCRRYDDLDHVISPGLVQGFASWIRSGQDRLTLARLAAMASSLGRPELAAALYI